MASGTKAAIRQSRYACGSGDAPFKIIALLNRIKWYIGFNLNNTIRFCGRIVSG